MTDYLRLAKDTAPEQPDPAAADNPYLALARGDAQADQARARTVLETALKDDPEIAAERQRLSKTTGVPLRVVERNLEELRVKERARMIDLAGMAEQSPVLYRQLVDPTFTSVASDDIPTLTKLERAMRYVVGAGDGNSLAGDVARGAVDVGLGATAGVGEGIFNITGAVYDLLGWESGARDMRYRANRSKEARQSFGLQADGSTSSAIKSGLGSAGTNLALLPIGLERGLFATAEAAATAIAGAMGTMVGADAYLQGRETGLGKSQSLAFGLNQGAFEFLLEKVPAGKLFGDLAGNAGLLKTLRNQAVSETWTEQLTTLAQDFNEWMFLHPEKTTAQFIAERPEAAYQTLIATLVGVGVQTGTISGINKIVEKASDQALAFEQDRLQELLKAAGQSALRERSPEQFRAHVERMVNETDGAKKEVYIDAEVLAQLPPEVLAQLPAAVQDQMQAALDAGSTVSIPMADVLTIAPGTPLEQTLNDYARLTPDALTRVEAQQAADTLRQDAERVLAQAQDQAAARAEYDAVQQDLAQQITATGRYRPAVAEAYASGLAHFFVAYGARTGLGTQGFYDAYKSRGFRIVGQPSTQDAALEDAGPKKPGEISVVGYHFSPQDRPVLSTAFYGTGLKGSARTEIQNNPDQRVRQRLSFYFDKGTGVRPEAGVGGRAHRVNLTGVYDADADPLKLRTGDARAFESKLLDLGYKGYATRLEGTQPGQVIMLGQQTFRPELLGAQSSITSDQVLAPIARAPQWQTQASGTPEQLQARLERMQANPAWQNYELRIEGNELQVREKATSDTLAQGGLTDGRSQPTGDGAGRYSSGSLAPLEGAPAVAGATGPDARLVAVAEQYALEAGIDLKRQATFVEVDEDRARRIAAAYEAMPHAPNDPRVKEAYEDLARQTLAQYLALQRAGYQFYLVDETNDPYAGNPWNAMRDLRANQRMGVFATEAGFGTSEFDPAGNPLLADTGLEWGYGTPDGPKKRVLFNDLFRAVHDAFGHGLEGAGFRARGEENAWQAHVRLFTGPAVGAITSETRGQNSWLNYGPHGEKNQTAKVEDTVFADQKTGLMPEWTWTEGRAPDADATLAQAPLGAPSFTTTYTDRDGETYDIRLTQETLGMGADRQLTVQVAAYQGEQRRARIDFALNGNTLASENTITAPAYRGKGLAEAMYRAAREAGYDIAPGRKQTADGEKMVGRLQAKGVINREQALAQQARGTFSPSALELVLNPDADLSTLWHEMGHFFLEVLADVAAQPNAPAQVAADWQTVLKHFGVTDEQWRGFKLDDKRNYHEQWARSVEAYIMEGKVPNAELAPLMRRFAAWLKSVYGSIKQMIARLPAEQRPQINDDIRRVMDRMLATDEQIQQANEAAGLMPDETADGEAQERLRKRSMADLKWTVKANDKAIKALQREADTIRKQIQAEVTIEADQTPEMRAKAALDALRITPEYQGLLDIWKTDRDTAAKAERERLVAELYAAHPDVVGLKKGQLLAKNKRAIANQVDAFLIEWDKANPKPARPVNMTDEDMATVADSFGYESVPAMLEAITAFGSKQDYIDARTEQRMLEEHGDLMNEDAIREAANEAVHNEARARSLASELRTQAEMLRARADTGETNAKGSKVTVSVLMTAAKQFAANVVGKTPLMDLKGKAWQHTAAERRAAKRWQEATAAGQTEEAVRAKQDQVLNNAAAKAALDARAEGKKILDFFARVLKGNDETTVEKGRDPDIVNAARAVLALYGLESPASKGAAAYLEAVKRNDPDAWASIEPMVAAVSANAQPILSLTFDELVGLHEQIAGMWYLAKRSRQMEIDGDLLDIDDLAEQLHGRLVEIGIPDRVPGEGMAVTKAEERGLFLKQGIAFLRRVEQWAEGMDGKYGGPFLRYVFQPVKDAADRYRIDRMAYRKRFQALVDNLAPIVGDSVIDAPELGYTFGTPGSSAGTAMNEILHALLHTGNESNKRKLLIGRGWAVEGPNGELDTRKWDAFVQRLVNEGKLERAHMDFVQGVWDLLEDTKPLAQKTHRDVFGRYFAEVTADAFVDPFGVTRRGGYVPAQVDPRLVKDNALKKLAEDENNNMAFAFPQPAKGFTMSRVEGYNRPLMLDLRTLSQHIDKVLLFSHMTPATRGVRKLLTNKLVGAPLDRVQPAALETMLQPWLQRSAQQVVETPVVGAGKWARVPSIVRARAGMALMFGNVSNTIQQITGLSSAAVKVKPSHLMRALAQFVAHPTKFGETVWALSPYMEDRAKNEVAVMNEQFQDILIKPSIYQRAQSWSMRHAYFLQTAFDNVLSPIVWSGAYNQALAEGMSDIDAIKFADGTVRQTQGSTLPEDVSRLETGPAYARVFTQFVGYFNMMANTNGTAIKQIADEVGLRKGAGKAFGVVMMGLLVPIWVAEAIAQAFKGGPDDPDKDGYLNDWLAAVFGFGTAKGLLAQIPLVGQFAVAGVNRLNNNPMDDRISLSPAVSLIEAAVGTPESVYKAIAKDGSSQKAVRDVATLVSVATGVPVAGLARPLGYVAGMADNKIKPTGPVDLARGLVTGTASPESKAK